MTSIFETSDARNRRCSGNGRRREWNGRRIRRIQRRGDNIATMNDGTDEGRRRRMAGGGDGSVDEGMGGTTTSRRRTRMTTTRKWTPGATRRCRGSTRASTSIRLAGCIVLLYILIVPEESTSVSYSVLCGVGVWCALVSILFQRGGRNRECAAPLIASHR